MKTMIRCLLSFVLLLASTSSLSAQGPAWPETVGGRFGREFFAAYAKQTDEALEAFVDEHYSAEYFETEKPREELIADMRSIHSQVGALEVRTVETMGDYGVRAFVYAERYGMWMKCEFELKEEAPHDPDTIAIRPTRAPGGSGPSAYDNWETLSELTELVRADLGAPALAVAVVHGGELSKAVSGVRRMDGKQAVKVDDRFHIGSVGKSFTATLVGRLVELDVLRFDVTVGEVLEDVDMRDEYRDVTLEELLQHRGGIQPMPSGGEFADGYSDLPMKSPVEGREAVTHAVLAEEPAFPPHTGMKYSNAGYVVAAVMVERLADGTWEELLREHVLAPLELSTAEIGWPATADRPDQPLGHFGGGDNLRVQEVGEPGLGGIDLGLFLAPAGDLCMSIEDLARYARFHMEGLQGLDGYLRSDTIRHLHEPATEGGQISGYACGWGCKLTPDGEPYQWHNGSGGTFFALVTIYPESDLAVVSASNVGLVANDYQEALHAALFARYEAANK